MLYNINPQKWGEAYWKTSHYITFAYPEIPTYEDKVVVKSYFENLKYLLPCQNCRSHYSQYLQTNPLTETILSSRYNLIKWLVDLHNSVNKRTGKKEYTIEQVISMYNENTNQSSLLDQYKNEIYLLVLIIIIALLVVYMKCK